jgi:hypothetical protein
MHFNQMAYKLKRSITAQPAEVIAILPSPAVDNRRLSRLSFVSFLGFARRLSLAIHEKFEQEAQKWSSGRWRTECTKHGR